MFGTNCFICAVQDRLALGASFLFGTNCFIGAVWDRLAPAAGFLFGMNIVNIPFVQSRTTWLQEPVFVWSEKFYTCSPGLPPGAQCLEKIVLYVQSGTAWLREPVLFGINCFICAVRDHLALGTGFVYN